MNEVKIIKLTLEFKKNKNFGNAKGHFWDDKETVRTS